MRRLLVLATILVVWFPAVANCGEPYDNLYEEIFHHQQKIVCECRQNLFEAEQNRLELQQFREDVLFEMRMQNEIQQEMLWQMKEMRQPCCRPCLLPYPHYQNLSCCPPDPLLVPFVNDTCPSLVPISPVFPLKRKCRP